MRRTTDVASRARGAGFSSIALLTGLGWGWGLLGLAALLLSGAALRRANGLPVQGFWVVVGLVCLAVAIWELFALSWPLIPVLIICFGVLILSGAFRPVHKG